jgi:hypothetical protein
VVNKDIAIRDSFDNPSNRCGISLQREFDALKTQNNEMKIRVQALERQAQLKDGMFVFIVFQHFLF